MKKKGFSLIELLISLITISVILASLAPVVTHKLKHGGVSVGSKKLTMTCPNTVGSSCTLCLGNQCIACPIGCGSGFKNTLTCKCETCTVSNCANCNSGSNQCDTCRSGCTKISSSECKCCPNGQYITGTTCTNCPKGYKCSNNTAVKCSGTQYQNETGKSDCKECEGVVSSDRTSCSNCALGTYWHSTNKTCTTCSTGNKCTGNNQQTPCTNSEYQDESGKSSCKTCSGVVNSSHNSCRNCNYFGSSCSTCTYDSCLSYNCSVGQYPASSGCLSCSSKFGSQCAACTASSCSSWTPCSNGKYINSSGNCSNCTDFGSACTNCTKDGCSSFSSCPDGKYGSKCDNNCPTGCKKCTSATNCTECNEDYALSNNTCKYDPCTKHNAILIQDGTTKFCMKKYNAGDAGGPSINNIALGEQTVKNGNTWVEYTDAHCWTNASPTSSTCTSSSALKSSFPGWDYESCNRTVCNWWAANYICTVNEPGWSLPTIEQLKILHEKYDNISKNQGANGLQLCDKKANYGAPQCEADSNLCRGSYYGCDASTLWSSTCKNNLCVYFWVSAGSTPECSSTYSAAYYTKSRAYSVRCVLNLP